MIRPVFLFAPLALLLAGLGASLSWPALAALPDTRERAGAAEADVAEIPHTSPAAEILPAAHQVRIEQHFSIRITPGAPVLPPEMLDEIQQTPPPERLALRHLSQCVAISSIGMVRGAEGNRLLLFMRDQHVVLAALEKACRAEDFYSGFYVARNGDGLLCTDRDTLQSRSGANCRLLALRELAPKQWRRFP